MGTPTGLSSLSLVMLSKRDVMDQLLAAGNVMVAVDTGYPGTRLPLDSPKEVVLRFGYDLHPRIADLATTEDELVGTLSFAGRPWHCTIPWGAIFAMKLDGTAHLIQWPPETVIEIEAELPRPKLRLV